MISCRVNKLKLNTGFTDDKPQVSAKRLIPFLNHPSKQKAFLLKSAMKTMNVITHAVASGHFFFTAKIKAMPCE